MLNPSFEGIPEKGSYFSGFNLDNWRDCGFAGESPPDIQPIQEGGIFLVPVMPFDGNSYLGLVVRDNETWESVSTRLLFPLVGNKGYKFSIAVCHSNVYQYSSTSTIHFDKPARLRIWGGNAFCSDEELLAETSAITDTVWQELNFEIFPKNTYTHIKLEAFYDDNIPTLLYNGNILLDKASKFEQL